MSAILCEGLEKRYGVHVALQGLDLDVPEGTLFGFLGPNGAGKSTTLRIVSGLVRADKGRARVFGEDVGDHVAATRRATFLIENAVFPPWLTAYEIIKRTADYMGVAVDEDVLERVGMMHARDRKAGGYSHGMKQRLGLACALLGKPDLLVLDEPQNGLDPQGLRTIRAILAEEHARGATVLVSVHRLAEVEGLCTHAAIVVNGRVVRQGDIESLLDHDPHFRLVVDDAERALAELPGAVRADGAILLEGDQEHAAHAAAACVRAGIQVYELAHVRKTLDDIYLDEVTQ